MKLPGDHLRVGISRSTPRHISGFRRLRALEPGPWFNSASPVEFHKLYMAQLNALDPRRSWRGSCDGSPTPGRGGGVGLLRGAARWRLVPQGDHVATGCKQELQLCEPRIRPRGLRLRSLASAAVAREVMARWDGKAG